MNSDVSANTLSTWGVGKRSNTDNVYLEYKLKTVKRFNTALLV